MYTVEILKFSIQAITNSCPTGSLKSLFNAKDEQCVSTRRLSLGLFEVPLLKSTYKSKTLSIVPWVKTIKLLFGHEPNRYEPNSGRKVQLAPKETRNLF